MRYRMGLAIAVVCGPVLASTAFAQSPASAPMETGVIVPANAGMSANAAFDRLLEGALREHNFPSLAAVVTRGDQVLYTRVIGFKDRDEQTPAAADTLYCIGSVTKVVTATLLVKLRDAGIVALDDPVSKYLPAAFVLPGDPRGAPAITLRHLATHTSGLPRISDNLNGLSADPYAGYTVEKMYESLGRMRLEFPVGQRVSYSNLGYALLGHALERAAGKPYEALLREHIFEPLGMRSACVTLDDTRRALLATSYWGHMPEVPVAHWDLGAYAPAGGVLCTAGELARFVALHAQAGGAASTLTMRPSSLFEMQQVQRLDRGWSNGVGLGWFREEDVEHGDDRVGHNGATFGFFATVAILPRAQLGVVLLSNCGAEQVEVVAHELLAEARRRYVACALDPRIRDVLQKLAGHIRAPDTGSKADRASTADGAPAAEGAALNVLFDPGFLRAVPISAVRKLFAKLVKSHGAFVAIKSLVAGQEPHSAMAQLQMERGVLRCEMRLAPDEPPRIVSLYFPPR